MEVHYYFSTTNANHRHLALGRLYSKPDPELLRTSYDTYKNVSSIQGDSGLIVVDVHAIHSVIGVIPDIWKPNTFFIAELPSLKSRSSGIGASENL
jgi:hypothetical protein